MKAGRRWGVGLGLLLCCCLMGFAAGQKEGAQGAAGKQVLTFYAGAYAPREKTEADKFMPPQYLWTVQKEYQKLHPNVEIQFVEIPAVGDFHAFITTRLTAGLAPDVFWWQTQFVSQNYKKGWVVDLTPYLDKTNPYVAGNKAWKDTFVSAALAASVSPDGRYYIINGDCCWGGIFYNKKILKELNLSAPTTWTEMMQGMAKMKQAGYTGLAFSMSTPWDNTAWFFRWMQDMLFDTEFGKIKGTGGQVPRTDIEGSAISVPELVRAVKEGRYSGLDPRWAENLRLLKEWSQYWSEGFLGLKTEDSYRQFMTGRAAMYVTGTYNMRALDSDPDRKFEFGMMQLPALTPTDSPYASGIPAPMTGGYYGSATYCIATSAGKKLDTAVDWLMYLYAPQNLNPIVNEAGGFMAGLKDLRDVDPRMAPLNEEFEKRHSFRLDIMFIFGSEFQDTLFAALQQYLGGRISVEQAQQQIQAGLVKAANDLAAANPEWGIK